MICSEARIAANRANSRKSCGPRSEAGKAASRRNGLKHGLTGRGLVTPEGDAEEIQGRVEALAADMKPRSPAGVILIAQMATLSVRAERAVERESAEIARNVRHAAADFDDGRVEEADALFEALADDPRGNLRRLRRSPEGVERLIEEWHDLRADLSPSPDPAWTEGHLERVARLTGTKARHARGSRLGALSRAAWGRLRRADRPGRRWPRGGCPPGLGQGRVAGADRRRDRRAGGPLRDPRLRPDRARPGRGGPTCLVRCVEAGDARPPLRVGGPSGLLQGPGGVPAGGGRIRGPGRVALDGLGAGRPRGRDGFESGSGPSPRRRPARAVASMGSSREAAPSRDREPARGPSDGPSGVDPVVEGSDGPPSRPPRHAMAAG